MNLLLIQIGSNLLRSQRTLTAINPSLSLTLDWSVQGISARLKGNEAAIYGKVRRDNEKPPVRAYKVPVNKTLSRREVPLMVDTVNTL